MKQTFTEYGRDFWSPEKLIIFFFLSFFLCVYLFQRDFYQAYCFTGEGIRNSPCYGFILDYVYTPLAAADSGMIIFTLLLLVLPLPLLHSWFKRIAIWSIPLGLFLFSLITPSSPGDVGPIATGTTPASFLEFIVQVWVVLLVGFLLYKVGYSQYQRLYSKTNISQS